MKCHAPAAVRNRDPIAAVLAQELPASGVVLEIASGTGEHAAHFARRFPHLLWQPSDPDPAALASIEGWRAEAALGNLLPPIALDAAAAQWPVDRADATAGIAKGSDSRVSDNSAVYRKFDACVCINMVHISEWAATVGLFKGCGQVLAQEAPIILYGPYLEEGVETAASNLAFDQSLKARNPAWGLRRLEDVDRLAAECGFARTNRYEMPANNLVLIYRRAARRV